ncbi:hypothetical protein HDU92_004655 [Lobulomyces angularis]|nr:hypothetical protein HDU92_004655 [Lobulomyces angularis]
MNNLINELLRPTEACAAFAELKTTSKHNRTVALIKNNKKEAAILVLKLTVESNKLEIKSTLPIYDNFRLAISQSRPIHENENCPNLENVNFVTEYSIKLVSDNKELRFLSYSLEDFHSLLVELKKFMAIAQQSNFAIGGESHSWLLYYQPFEKSEDIQLENIISENIVDIKKTNTNPFIVSESSIHPRTAQGIKNRWVNMELRKREEKFCDFKDLKLTKSGFLFRIFTATWNVGGTLPPKNLNVLLNSPTFEGEADIIVLGFQEIDLTTSAYLISDTTKENEWVKAIEAGLGEKKDLFYKAASKQLVGMLILVFVKKVLHPHVSELTSVHLGTGILGMMGNKGGVAVRMRVFDSYVTFVNCHLAADPNYVERRNQDFQGLYQGLLLPSSSKYTEYSDYVQANPWVPNINDSPEYTLNINLYNQVRINSGKPICTVFDSDILIWLGDLNYRIPIPDTEAKAFLDQGQYGIEQLLLFDQLTNEKMKDKCFKNFLEGKITFSPSYKFDIGTNVYDSSEKRRSPSWCDRILFFKNPLLTEEKRNLELLYYGMKMDFLSSDHKPVFAEFKSKHRIVNLDKLNKCNDDILRELDKFENEALPILEIDTNNLDFGEVKLLSPVTRSIIIENRGQVISQFRFIPKMDELSISKPWCFINQTNSMLLPGEKLKVMITILVENKNLSYNLNFGKELLEDILILHVEGSRDHFISIQGNWLTTSFGMDLEVLCFLTKPVREYTTKDLSEILKKKEASIEEDFKDLKVTSFPPQIGRIAGFIHDHAMEMDELFTAEGDLSLIEYIIECIDSGLEFDLDSITEEVTEEADSDLNSPPSAKNSTQNIAALQDNANVINLDVDLLIKSRVTSAKPEYKKTFLECGFQCRGKGLKLFLISLLDVFKLILNFFSKSLIPEEKVVFLVNNGYLDLKSGTQCLETLPPTCKISFLYVTAFLKDFCTENKLYRGKDGFNFEKMAAQFAPILLRNEEATLQQQYPFNISGPILNATSSLEIGNSKIKYSTVGNKQGQVLVNSTLVFNGGIQKNNVGLKISKEVDVFNRKRKMFLKNFLEC